VVDYKERRATGWHYHGYGKIKTVLDNGMKFDTPMGAARLIPKPDMGVTRTADLIIGDIQ